MSPSSEGETSHLEINQMLKIRKLDIVVASALLAFFMAWHYRADFIEIGRAAAKENASLAQECK